MLLLCCGVEEYFFEEHNVIARLILFSMASIQDHKVNKFKEISYIIRFGF